MRPFHRRAAVAAIAAAAAFCSTPAPASAAAIGVNTCDANTDSGLGTCVMVGVGNHLYVECQTIDGPGQGTWTVTSLVFPPINGTCFGHPGTTIGIRLLAVPTADVFTLHLMAPSGSTVAGHMTSYI